MKSYKKANQCKGHGKDGVRKLNEGQIMLDGGHSVEVNLFA